MSLPVTVEELQALLSHENAFTRPFGFLVESVGTASALWKSRSGGSGSAPAVS